MNWYNTVETWKVGRIMKKTPFEITWEILTDAAELNPYSVDSLLTAHGAMMHGLIEEAGLSRSGAVGVADSNGTWVHCRYMCRKAWSSYSIDPQC